MLKAIVVILRLTGIAAFGLLLLSAKMDEEFIEILEAEDEWV